MTVRLVAIATDCNKVLQYASYLYINIFHSNEKGWWRLLAVWLYNYVYFDYDFDPPCLFLSAYTNPYGRFRFQR